MLLVLICRGRRILLGCSTEKPVPILEEKKRKNTETDIHVFCFFYSFWALSIDFSEYRM